MSDDVKVKKRRGMSKRLLKHKIFRFRNVFSFISVFVSIVFIISLFVLNLIPLKYSILGSILLIILNVLGVIFINVHKKIILKIIGWILLILITIGSLIGTYYILVTNSFLDKSFTNKKNVNTITYYVVANKNNNYTKSDIKGDIATYKYTYNINKAFNRLNEGFTIENKSYSDLNLMFTDVLNNVSNFMLIEKSSYEIVFSLDDTLDKSKYDIVYEFTISEDSKSTSSSNNTKFNIFIGGKDFAGLMDFNAIATVNLEKHTILLTAMPRDYYIEVPGMNGVKDKLSFMSAYGIDTNKEAIENFLGITIDYTIYVNTDSLIDIVDYVGGIEFCSDMSYTTTHALVKDTYDDTKGKKLTINKGCQTLNGIEALTVARERNAFVGRDRIRQQNCQKIMIAIFKKLATPKTALKYNETLDTLSDLYESNISRDLVSVFAKDMLTNGNKWTITTQQMDGLDGHETVHLSNMIDWVTYPDMTTVNSCINGIKEALK